MAYRFVGGDTRLAMKCASGGGCETHNALLGSAGRGLQRPSPVLAEHRRRPQPLTRTLPRRQTGRNLHTKPWITALANEELGIKRDCPNCGARFYDLKKDPAHCPKCDEEFTPEVLLKPRRGRPDETAAKAKASKETEKDEDEEDDEEDEDEIPADERETSLDEADETGAEVKTKKRKSLDDDDDEEDDGDEEKSEEDDIDEELAALELDEDDDTLIDDDDDDDDDISGVVTGSKEEEER